MLVQASKLEPHFQPIKLEIVLESETELAAMKTLGAFGAGVADFLREERRSKSDSRDFPFTEGAARELFRQIAASLARLSK